MQCRMRCNVEAMLCDVSVCNHCHITQIFEHNTDNPYLPKLYMCAMFIGSKGSGKTFSLVSLSRHYEKSSILDKKGRKHIINLNLMKN